MAGVEYTVVVPTIQVQGCGIVIDLTDELAVDGANHARDNARIMVNNVPEDTGALRNSSYIILGYNEISMGFSIRYAEYVKEVEPAVAAYAEFVNSYVLSRVQHYFIKATLLAIQSCIGPPSRELIQQFIQEYRRLVYHYVQYEVYKNLS